MQGNNGFEFNNNGPMNNGGYPANGRDQLYRPDNVNMGNMGQGLGAVRGYPQDDILNAVIKTNMNNELHQIRHEIQNQHVILSKQLEDIKVSIST